MASTNNISQCWVFVFVLFFLQKDKKKSVTTVSSDRINGYGMGIYLLHQHIGNGISER